VRPPVPIDLVHAADLAHAADLVHDKAEGHLAMVTLGLHATLKGLAAPVELLAEALTLKAPMDAFSGGCGDELAEGSATFA
jgi:hypothetical protein